MADGTERPQILVVDDNRAFAENLQEILEAAGYGAQMADTCADARKLFAHTASVALIDLHLPDGDGRELAGELKRLHPDAEVILLTGHATVESAAASVRAGGPSLGLIRYR